MNNFFREYISENYYLQTIANFTYRSGKPNPVAISYPSK